MELLKRDIGILHENYKDKYFCSLRTTVVVHFCIFCSFSFLPFNIFDIFLLILIYNNKII